MLEFGVGCAVAAAVAAVAIQAQAHAFCSRKLFDAEQLVPCLKLFENKLRRRHALGGASSDRPVDVVQLQHKPAKPCNKIVAQEVSAFLGRCRAKVLEAALAARRRTACARVSNMPFVVKCALCLIHQWQLVAVSKDKEPGFTSEYSLTLKVLGAHLESALVP